MNKATRLTNKIETIIFNYFHRYDRERDNEDGESDQNAQELFDEVLNAIMLEDIK
jgi:hypothetical protein